MTPNELKLITQQLGIDKPIMRTELTDQRLKIYLYGGQVIEHELKPQLPTLEPNLIPVLEQPELHDRETLRLLAQALEIPGAEGMNKKALVTAVNQWKQNHA